jgi:putative flippase GtrA
MVFLRYMISGGAAAAVHFALLIALVKSLDANPTLASAIGFCAAILVNYSLQYYWTFNTRGTHTATFVRYLGLTLMMLGVNTGLFWLMNVQVGLNYLVAQAIATIIVVPVNFQVNRRVTFPHRPDSEGTR